MSMTKRSALQQLDSSLHRVDWADVEELSMAGIGSFCDVLRVHINSSEMEPKEYDVEETLAASDDNSSESDSNTDLEDEWHKNELVYYASKRLVAGKSQSAKKWQW